MWLKKIRKWLIHTVLKVRASEVKGGVITKTDPTRHQYAINYRYADTEIIKDEYKIAVSELKHLHKDQMEEVLTNLQRDSIRRIIENIIEKELYEYEEITLADSYLQDAKKIRITMNVLNPNKEI